MKKLLFLLFFLPLFSIGQINFFGVGTNPTDGGSVDATGGSLSCTPPASMQTGDLVIMFGSARLAAITITVNTTGGQSWNSLDVMNSTNYSARMFWCRFNGTWSADPAIAITNTNATSLQLFVFRPTTSTNTWGVDVAFAFSAFSGTGAKTITGINTVDNSTVSFAFWSGVGAAATWGSLSGTGWVKTSLSAQYVNNDGNRVSNTFAYQIKTSAGATNNVAQTPSLSTNGDMGIISFKEITGGTTNLGSMFKP